MQSDPITLATQGVDVVKALAPLFAAGVAIQQFTDLVDSGLSSLAPATGLGDAKKFVVKLLAVVAGFTFVLQSGISVFASLLPGSQLPAWLDHTIAALIVGGGTEGVNSIVKFLGYAKEEKKAEAGKKQVPATSDERVAMERVART